MNKHSDENYDAFYRRGGWQYDPSEEMLFLVYRVLQPLRVKPGIDVLELGCGMGLHSALFFQCGMRVTGIDLSEVGIAEASRRYPGPAFLHGDAHEYLAAAESASFDLVFASGMSWFHHNLRQQSGNSSINLQDEMKAIFRVLRPEGYFILRVRTDFSGTVHETGIVNHRWEDIVEFLDSSGELLMLTNWSGLPLTSPSIARRFGGNVLAAVRKRRISE
ncbi:MAG TPA: class I SAM-dependent methyltransferase [Bryobacteraceae bacterium]|nr:class I SAM-dependent methyltransferase [Bryobacteraceae bacterium]